MSTAIDTRSDTDVLIIGGGMAGAWAALGAARAGAQVTLVDKGCVGTSGVTAAAGPGHWWVAPEHREEAVRQRAIAGEGLAEPYCRADVLSVEPAVERAAPADDAATHAGGLLGVFRRDSGWDQGQGDHRFCNKQWRTEAIFARGRELHAAAQPAKTSP
jgi:choline dehydrogenase-like flavoprotein